MSLDKNKKGFTLIELLVVIGIVAMLSTLAVNGYVSYRRATLLDLAMDDIVAQIYEMKDKTLHGDFNSNRKDVVKSTINDSGVNADVPVFDESEAQCYGMTFDISSGGFDVSTYSQSFDSQKKFIFNGWGYVGCGDNENETMLVKDELIVGESITYINAHGAESDWDGFALKFIPPRGVLQVVHNDTAITDVLDGDTIEVAIKYGEGEDSRFKTKLVFDLYSNNFYVEKDEI